MKKTTVLVVCFLVATIGYADIHISTIPGVDVGFVADNPATGELLVESFNVGYRLAKHGSLRVPFILWPEDMKPLQKTDGYYNRIIVEEDVEQGLYLFNAGDTLCIVRVYDIDIPPAEASFGFYYQNARIPVEYRTEEMLEAYYEDMRDHGQNSVTFYDYCPVDTKKIENFQIYDWLEKAIEVGLCDKDHPVVWLGIGPNRADVLNDLEIPDDWPQLYIYGPDEPAVGDQEIFDRLEKSQKKYAGFPVITAISGNAVAYYFDYLDAFLVHRPGVDRYLKKYIEDNNKVFGAYDCGVRGTNYRHNRLYAGIFTWVYDLKFNYLWAYTHHKEYAILSDGTHNIDLSRGYVIPSPEGPLPTIGYEGRRDGVLDYRLLKACEDVPEAQEYLDKLRHFFRGVNDTMTGRKGYYWDISDTADPYPDFDFGEMRQILFGYLSDAYGKRL